MILLCLYVTEALLSNDISGKRKPKCCTQITSQKKEACQSFEISSSKLDKNKFRVLIYSLENNNIGLGSNVIININFSLFCLL